MYIKKCKWCENDITVEKQCLFALHICNCDSNPNKFKKIEKFKLEYSGKEKKDRLLLKQECPKCGIEFEIRLTKRQFENNKYKKFCSIKCANSRKMDDVLRNKISESCRKSEKVKNANKIQTEGRKNRNKNKIKINKTKIKNNEIKSNKIEKEIICLHCGKKIISKRYKKNRKYHSDCWLKISGGIREGSSRGKSGWYKGYWCDSSYELAFIIYNLEHNIEIERNKKGYKYFYNNKEHIYYPDFRVNGKLVEIKNYKSELTNIKLLSVDEEIEIYYKDTIKPYIEYVKNKYGKNFINLYENNMEVPIVRG